MPEGQHHRDEGDRGADRPRVNVVPMTEDHLDRVCDVMVRSFQNEPIMRHTLPDEARRAEQVRWLFGKCALYAIRYGRAYTTEDVRGFSVWLSPGDPDMQVWRLLRLGMAAAPLKLGIRPLGRLMRFGRIKDRIHHEAAPEPHWYLLMIGVDPTAQGGGIGSALVRPIFEQADAEGRRCYLETGAEQNTKIFGKYGFETVVETDIVPGELHLWGMVRPPGGAQRHKAQAASAH